MEFKNFFHIINPNENNRRAVRRFFKKNTSLRGVWIERVSHPQHLETAVDWALSEGKSQMAVWAGEGTLNRTLQALYRNKALEKITLALVPVGTCNDFARKRNFGSWKKWARYYMNGQNEVQSVDLGLLECDSKKRVFINNAGFGRTKEALSQARANPLSDIFGFTEKKIQAEWGTEKINQFETLRVFFGIVFNGPYFGGGKYFSKKIEPDDGLLNAFLVPPQSRMALLSKFFRSKLGGSLRGPSDIMIEAAYIHLDSEEKLYPQVDGEVVTEEGAHSLRFSMMDGMVRLLVPTENR